eukprot:734597-Prorocentrum_minimum.AAC.1
MNWLTQSARVGSRGYLSSLRSSEMKLHSKSPAREVRSGWLLTPDPSVFDAFIALLKSPSLFPPQLPPSTLPPRAPSD